MSTLDPGSTRYATVVLQDDGDHRESTLGKFYEQAGSWQFTSSNFVDVRAYSVNNGNSQNALTDRVEAWKDLIPPMSSFLFLDFPDTKQLIYTFPSVHSDVDKVLFDGGNEDRVQAENIADVLTTSLNDSIAYIIKESGFNPNAEGNLTPAEWLMNIGQELSIQGTKASMGNDSSFLVNGVSFTLTPFTGDATGLTPIKDLEGNYNYLEISNSGSNRTVIAQFKVPKGYYSSSNAPSQAEFEYQPLLKNVPKDFLEPIREADVSHISWGHIVLQASYLYDVHSITSARMDAQYKPNMFEQYAVETFGGLFDSLKSTLGLYSFQELILNRGTRGSTTYFGIFPIGYYGPVMLLYVLCFIIATALLIVPIIKMVFSRSMAAISTSRRVSLMEGMKDYIVTLLFMFLSLPFITSFLKLIFEFNLVLNRATDSIHFFGSVEKMSSGLLSGIAIIFVELIMRIYINFVYIYRGLLCGALIGLSPLFICSIAFGGKYKYLFTTWLKELVGLALTQPIHALVLIFYSSLLDLSATRVIENLVMMASFIPITAYIKKQIGGLPDGGGEGVAKGLTMGSAAIGAGLMLGASKLASSRAADKLASEGGGVVAQAASAAGGARMMDNGGAASGSASTIPQAMATKKAAGDLIGSVGSFIEEPSLEGFKDVLGKGGTVKDQLLSNPIAQVTMEAGKTAAYAGMAVGAAATGDNFHAYRFGNLAGDGLVKAGASMPKMVKGFTNKKLNYDERALSEASAFSDSKPFTPETLEDSGVTDFTYNEPTGSIEVTQSLEGLEKNYGITNVMNPSRRSIGIEYSHDVLNNSEKLQKMHADFQGDTKKSKEKYYKQGVIGTHKSAGGIVVEYDKEAIGLDYAKTNPKLGVVQFSTRNGTTPELPQYTPDKEPGGGIPPGGRPTTDVDTLPGPEFVGSGAPYPGDSFLDDIEHEPLPMPEIPPGYIEDMMEMDLIGGMPEPDEVPKKPPGSEENPWL